MIAFGGAGPLHACDLAEEMSMNKVIIPPHPGLFSAYGLLTVDLARLFSMPVMSTDLGSLEKTFAKLRDICRKTLAEEHLSKYSLVESADLRYRGQSFEINLPYHSPSEDMRRLFDERHKALYGYSSPESEVEAVNAKIRAIVPVPKIERQAKKPRDSERGITGPEPRDFRTAWVSGTEVKVPLFVRKELLPSNNGAGPCIIEEYDSTTIVNSGWSWTIDELGNIRLARL